MKNPRLDASLEVLRAAEESISRKTIMDLIDAIIAAPAVEYEVDDFIQYNEGMGEAGFGIVVGCKADRYQVETWTPDAEQFPSYTTTVMAGDITGLSSPGAASLHFQIRNRT